MVLPRVLGCPGLDRPAADMKRAGQSGLSWLVLAQMAGPSTDGKVSLTLGVWTADSVGCCALLRLTPKQEMVAIHRP